MTVVIKEVHPHIVTFQDSKGRWESLSWHEFAMRRQGKEYRG